MKANRLLGSVPPFRTVVLGIAAGLLTGLPPAVRAEIITYQGRVQSGGSNFTGTGQFKFALVTGDDPAFNTIWSNDGSIDFGNIAPTNPVPVAVNEGLFTVRLGDTALPNMIALHASVFEVPDLKLRIWFDDGVNGSAPFSPAQPLTVVPYAIRASTVETGTISNPVFLGTTTATPFELFVNNRRAMRFEDNGDGSDADSTPDGAPNLIGGSHSNEVGPAVVGATIAGGGAQFIAGATGPTLNSVLSDYGSVGGGFGNSVAPSAFGATVGGGGGNTASGNYATVGGGFSNTADASRATVGGGDSNTASGSYATVAGGFGNSAGGSRGTVPGGHLNEAGGDFSFAAGFRAKANHDGAFVWGDTTASDFTSTANRQFLIRAAGGVGIGTNSPVGALQVNGGTVVHREVVPAPTASTNLLNLMVGGGSNPAATNGALNGISFYEASTAPAMSLGYDGSGSAGNNALRVYDTASNTPLCTFQQNGNVGIGTTAPTARLHVNGTATVAGALATSGPLAVTAGTGDGAVTLPSSSISAAETLQEAGLASDNVEAVTPVPTNGVTTLATRTLNAPSDGYVIAFASADFDAGIIAGDAGPALAIQKTSAPAASRLGFTGNRLGSLERTTISGHAVFAVSSGNNTFRLDGSTSGNEVSCTQRTLTLLFVPTAYGATDVQD